MFVDTSAAFYGTLSFFSLTSMEGGIYHDLTFHFPNLQRVTGLFNECVAPLSEESTLLISLTPALISVATEYASQEKALTLEKVYVAVQKAFIFVDVTLTLLALHQSIYLKNAPSIFKHSATCTGKLLHFHYGHKKAEDRIPYIIISCLAFLINESALICSQKTWKRFFIKTLITTLKIARIFYLFRTNEPAIIVFMSGRVKRENLNVVFPGTLLLKEVYKTLTDEQKADFRVFSGNIPNYVVEKIIYNLAFGSKRSLDIPPCFNKSTQDAIQHLRFQKVPEEISEVYASYENYQKEIPQNCKDQKQAIIKLFHDELQGSPFTKECWKYVDPNAD